MKRKKIKGFCFYLAMIFLSACVPQGNSPYSPMDVQSLQQSPELSGDFGSQNQLASVDRVFTISKSSNEELSEITTISLVGDSSFSVIHNGCEKALKKQEKCFVRAQFRGSKLVGASAGLKTAILSVGSLEIPLSVDFDPILSGEVEVTHGNDSIEDKMDIECLNGVCTLVLKYTNKSAIPQTPSSLVVPMGYVIQSNSCGSILAARKSCYVRLKIQESMEDLNEGEISLNVNGEAVTTQVRVLKELDTVAPVISPEILNGVEYDEGIYVLGTTVDLRLTLSDDRPASKGLKYSISLGQTCSSSIWEHTQQSVNEISFSGLVANQGNYISLKAKDALDNESACVSLEIKNLAQKTYSVAITQPSFPGSGLSVTVNPVLYGQSTTITFAPKTGMSVSSWGGDCSGVGSGNTCVLSNVSSNKNVSMVAGCNSGYDPVGNECLPIVNAVVSTNHTNPVLYSLAGAPNYKASIYVTINAGVVIGSASINSPALATGSFVAGSVVRLINKGTIVGKGGNGGKGVAWSVPGVPGEKGGDAISLGYNIIIDNQGIIGGGGGGGGGGSGVSNGNNYCRAGGGGGGGAGSGVGTGAMNTNSGDNTYCGGDSARHGSDGSLSTGGDGGSGLVDGPRTTGSGGKGGDLGQAGNDGVRSTGTGSNGLPLAGDGGAAGRAIITNGYNIQWIQGNDSTRLKGAIQ